MIGLIAWGRFFKTDSTGTTSTVTVPAPSTDPGKPYLSDFLHANAKAIGDSFDVVQWPPISKAQGGNGAGCDGYGLFDRYDLGTKPQQGSTPTRYGFLEGKLAAIAALNAYGTQSYGDLVLHQYIGENGGPGVFTYLGADSKTLNGKGATTASMFRGGTGANDLIPPFCKEDAVAGGVSTDTPFGREVSYQNCLPSGITTSMAIDFLQWLTQRTGFAGYRYDDVKGTWSPAVAEIANSTTLPIYGEFYDGNPANLNAYATSNPINSRLAVADFTFHYRAQAACNGFDATQFFQGGNGGYWQWNPGLSVLFMDNPDTDVSGGAGGSIGSQIVFNKGIGYAIMLSLPARMALVYGKDYFPDSVWPGSYGLKPLIDNICWISRMFAFGALAVRYEDKDVLVVNRDGNGGSIGWSGGLLTGINFNVLTSRTVRVATSFGPNRWLHDYTGHAPDVWTDSEGYATITIPSNAYSSGESYVMYAPGGVDKPYPSTNRPTTQVFIGDSTLDVMPVKSGLQSIPQAIYCAAKSTFTVLFQWSPAELQAAASVQLEVVDPAGVIIAHTTLAATMNKTTLGVVGTTDEAGWYTIRLVGNLLPAEGVNFVLKATYQGENS